MLCTAMILTFWLRSSTSNFCPEAAMRNGSHHEVSPTESSSLWAAEQSRQLVNAGCEP